MKLKIKFSLFVFFCSLFIAAGFTTSNYIHIPVENVTDVAINLIHFLLVFAGILVLCYLIAINRYLFLTAFPIIVLLSSAVSFFIYTQNLTLTTSVLDAALHNDLRTSADIFTLPLIIFLLAAVSVAVFAACYRFKYIQYRFKWMEFILVIALALSIYSINRIRNNTVFQRIPFSIYYAGKQYISQEQSSNRSRKTIGEDAITKADTLTLILVIGEACRADHMQLNGYLRVTNPRLTRLNVISYPRIYSEWTHTNASLPHFLTRSDSVNHNPATQEQSFISIFNRCGFSTAWIANQEPAPSYFSFVKEAQNLVYVNPAHSVYNFNKKWLDSDNLKFLDQELLKHSPRKLIIIHTIGSHWWYNDHFTDCLAIFKPILNSKIISPKNMERMINSYDNTIVSTDYFLSEVIKRLDCSKACLIYLSDHGESLGENGKWLHAQDNGPERLPACVIWYSKKYEEKYPRICENLIKNRQKKWRTEFLFSSILSMADISTNIKIPELDITHPMQAHHED